MQKISRIVKNSFMAPPSGLGFNQSWIFWVPRFDLRKIVLLITYQAAEGKINPSRMKISAATIYKRSSSALVDDRDGHDYMHV